MSDFPPDWSDRPLLDCACGDVVEILPDGCRVLVASVEDESAVVYAWYGNEIPDLDPPCKWLVSRRQLVRG
jgi:hypothetical protein